MLIARYSADYTKVQSLKEHSLNVAESASLRLKRLHLSSVGFLAGLMHDLGKSTAQWQSAIKEAKLKFNETQKEKNSPLGVPHAPVSAAAVYNLLYDKSKSSSDRACLQMLCAAIYAHHGYLPDILSVSGEQVFFNLISGFEPEDPSSLRAYFEEVCCEEKIYSIWEKAKAEFRAFILKAGDACKDLNSPHLKNVQAQFIIYMITRMVYSSLIDADRLDAQTFEDNNNYSSSVEGSVLKDCAEALEKYVERLEKNALNSGQNKYINSVRSQISSACKSAARSKEHLFSLRAPTGGGKTIAGLRWALNKADIYGRRRIFYIVSYTTILDQVYGVYKNALSGSRRKADILLHHSNIIDEDADVPNAVGAPDVFAERWNADIILTTQVQFFNALFLGTGRAARRMQSLQNSVIIFDEVQTVPPKLKYLFNLSIRYLTEIAGCDILLSSATQADFEKMEYPMPKIKSIFKSADNLFEKMKRVKLIDKTKCEASGPDKLASFAVNLKTKCKALGPDELASFAVNLQRKFGSLLIVVNTRKAALITYEAIKKIKPAGVEIILLSNNLCPAHRNKIISHLKASSCKNVICISTQLIECGVDLSFACAIRSLAGADSVWQAAGRCNRHGEREIGFVYIVKLDYENLDPLPDIKDAQYASEKLFFYLEDADLLQNPENMETYYSNLNKEPNIKSKLPFPLKIDGLNVSMVDLLSLNQTGYRNFKENNPGGNISAVNRQAFACAGKNFSVIDSGAKAVIVPYEEGEEIINELNSFSSLHNEKALLRRAQLFSVNIYDYSLNKLKDSGALYTLPCGAAALKNEWYDDKTGLLEEPVINADKYIF